jgi:hypothetical protein
MIKSIMIADIQKWICESIWCHMTAVCCHHHDVKIDRKWVSKEKGRHEMGVGGWGNGWLAEIFSASVKYGLHPANYALKCSDDHKFIYPFFCIHSLLSDEIRIIALLYIYMCAYTRPIITQAQIDIIRIFFIKNIAQ